MKKIAVIASALILMPQCARIARDKTFAPVEKQAHERIGISPRWEKRQSALHAYPIETKDFKLHDAIVFGIEHNVKLQSHFDELGIKKADLVQAGFFTNPYVESIFRIPKKCSDLKTNIETSVNFMLSDLWQVPLRKKVAQHELSVKTYEVINQILLLRHDIQRNYLTCVYHKKHVALIREMIAYIDDLQERTEYRYQFGYVSPLEKFFIASKRAEWEAKLVEEQSNLFAAYIALQEVLGAPIVPKKLHLSDCLCVRPIDFNADYLENIARTSHPYILIEQAKIARARATISYEQSRVIDNVQIGLAHEHDFEKGAKGLGPSFGISVPLFNTNYGNIERARFEMAQAEDTRIAQERMIIRHVLNHFALYKAGVMQIDHYIKHVLPPVIEALRFSKEFYERMQMSLIVFLNAQIDLVNLKIKFIDIAYKTMQEYIELEFNVGNDLGSLIS